MRVFVTGACGQLGHDLVRELVSRGAEVVGSDIKPECEMPDGARYVRTDITDRAAVRKTLTETHPEAVIHCAAWTAVDAAEQEENRERVRRINAGGTKNLAEASASVGAKMMYLSTDYVFDGQGTAPWQPECRAFAPLNVYGRTKLEGEQAVREALDKYFIVRIAWVFGEYGQNFVRTMLRVGRGRESVTVVDDQIGTPTYTKDLSVLLADMIATDRYGVYHATNSEEREGAYISWADFAEEIYRAAGYPTRVDRVTTAEYGKSLAKRPLNSRLDKRKLRENGFAPLPSWKDAVRRYVGALAPEEKQWDRSK